MEYSISYEPLAQITLGCVVVGIFEPRRLTPSAAVLDQASGGFLTRLIKQGDLSGRTGQALILYDVPGVRRVLVLGLGKEDEFGDSQYRAAIGKMVSVLSETGSGDAAVALIELPVRGRSQYEKIRLASEAAAAAEYRFERLKSAPEAPGKLTHIAWHISQPDGRESAALRDSRAINSGLKLTKDLANLPGNICTPSYLAEQAQELVRGYPQHPVRIEVLDRAALERLSMGALLAVAQGTCQPPQLIVMEYRAGGETKPVVLVGKGITFDSGGISLKPGEKMDEMKFDMSGGAALIGTFKAVLELALPINLVALIPATENLPDGKAIKPGDIVTSMSGQTIEILNTDAEGRLILCDALTYAARWEPDVVIDVATLTGACVVALGKHPSGLLANHPPLAQDLIRAGNSSGDRVWELPLWEEYQEQLKSNFADMSNVGGREAGVITAACFLARYAKKLHWAHIDIAGTAWLGGDKKGATGRPVSLLVQYLLDRSPPSAT